MIKLRARLQFQVLYRLLRRGEVYAEGWGWRDYNCLIHLNHKVKGVGPLLIFQSKAPY